MKKFKELLIKSIDEDIHGTTIEKLVKVKEVFESEMVYKGKKPTPELLTEWLQGLCWAVSVPYENWAIIEWYEQQLKRKVQIMGKKDPDNYSPEVLRWLERYWVQLGLSLYELLYK